MEPSGGGNWRMDFIPDDGFEELFFGLSLEEATEIARACETLDRDFVMERHTTFTEIDDGYNAEISYRVKLFKVDPEAS